MQTLQALHFLFFGGRCSHAHGVQCQGRLNALLLHSLQYFPTHGGPIRAHLVAVYAYLIKQIQSDQLRIASGKVAASGHRSCDDRVKVWQDLPLVLKSSQGDMSEALCVALLVSGQPQAFVGDTHLMT